MSDKQTYWQLIDSNRIEIPVIQRDYAQGREEDRINALRRAFISDLKHSICGDGEPLHLGFIYGKVEGRDKYQERLRNKRAIENILNAVEGYAQHLEMKIETTINSDIDYKNGLSNLPTFIPLDGQQRLTTLFLIHWYLSLFFKENKQDVVNILCRFTYKTRKSSFEFCRAITDYKTHSDFEFIVNETISEFIKKRKWFRRSWLKDSTVKGMLTVLDEIQEQFADIDDKSILFSNLIRVDAPILFDFLDLDELNQTDELYVKMNARGKQLTEFEHFKAWLIHYVKKNKIIIEEQDWKTKLDKEWFDLFWKNKGTSYSVDDTVYNFIKQVTLFAYIHESNKEFNLEFTSTVRESEFIPFSMYEEYNFFNSHTLNFVFNTLNHLSNHHGLMSNYNDWLTEIACYPFLSNDENLLKVFMRSAKPVDRPLSVFYYSLILFMSMPKDIENETKFKTWMRLSRNLIYNTYIQNPDNYVDAIRGLKGLIQIVEDEAGINFTSKSVSFFGSIFLYNEKLKLDLIDSGEAKWRELILKYENHEYFRGDIRVIISFSQKELGKYTIEDFEMYGKILFELFSRRIRGHKEVLLQRALLCKGLYMPQVGSNYLFCLPNSDTLRARRDNWQKVFSDQEKSVYLKQLIDEHLKNADDIEAELRNVILSYIENDWRKYLIKSSLPIRFCENGYVRLQGFISANDSKLEVFLLRTSKLYGRHAELRSYYHYVTSIKKLDKLPFTELEYWENRMGQYAYPCVRFYNWHFNGVNYKLEITYSEAKKYQFYLLSEGGSEVIHDNIIKCCEGLGWQTSEDKLRCFESTDNEVEILDIITSSLRALNAIK